MQVKLSVYKDMLAITISDYSNGSEEGFIFKHLQNDESFIIHKTYQLGLDKLISKDETFGTYSFKIGTIRNEFVYLDKEVFDIEHGIAFSKDIKFDEKLFVAPRRISIIKRIDRLLQDDLFISTKHMKIDYLPFSTYKKLIDEFPNSTELTKYSEFRISVILRDFVQNMDNYIDKFDKYITKKENKIELIKNKRDDTTAKTNLKINLLQFTQLRDNLDFMLNNGSSYSEKEWQKVVCEIFKCLYPKYILILDEVYIKGVDIKDKQVDFLLIDDYGYVDLLEIKVPDVQILTEHPSYRNNYIPVRALSGVVQQLEKYIYCMNAHKEDSEKKIKKKCEKNIKTEMDIKILNPQGIVLAGRSKNFDDRKRNDFELIKRQYKNICEIMTYDDLLNKLNNIVYTLSRQVEKINEEVML